MKKSRFQNRVAESNLTLPVCALLTTVLWCWWPNFMHDAFLIKHYELIIGWALCALTTYVLLETNNRNVLIRIRTRMVACSWLALVACMGFLHADIRSLGCAFCLSASHYLLFSCYQQVDAVNNTFHSFFFLGLGSLAFPPVLVLAVCYYGYLAGYLRSLCWRSFWAGIVGLLIPYWVWACWCLWGQDFSPFIQHFLPYFQFVVSFVWTGYRDLSLDELACWAFVTLLSMIGIIHYLRTSYNDKIRVRMIFNVLICQALLIQVAMVFFPIYFRPLVALYVVSSAPLVAHYFSLTTSKYTNAFFCLCLVMMVAYCLWSTVNGQQLNMN